MKHTIGLFLFAFVLLAISCKTDTTEDIDTSTDTQPIKFNLSDYDVYGDTITTKKEFVTGDAIANLFEQLEDGDSVKVQVKSNVNEVCKVKGCWMVIDAGNDQTARVSFRDYGFFVPKDLPTGKEVILDGWAKKKLLTVDELRHYAEDAGKSEEEVNAITEAEVKLTVVADGVLIPKS